MIKTVHLRSFMPNDIPHKFEAGTPAIAEAIGFGAAVEYLTRLGMEAVAAHERRWSAMPWNGSRKSRVCRSSARLPIRRAEWRPLRWRASTRMTSPRSWTGMASPCAPAITAPSLLHEKFGITATARASFYVYSLKEEVDALVNGIYKVKRYLGEQVDV